MLNIPSEFNLIITADSIIDDPRKYITLGSEEMHDLKQASSQKTIRRWPEKKRRVALLSYLGYLTKIKTTENSAYYSITDAGRE